MYSKVETVKINTIIFTRLKICLLIVPVLKWIQSQIVKVVMDKKIIAHETV